MKGYQHGAAKHSSGESVRGKVHANGIESVRVVRRRGYHGEYHHRTWEHMARYVNELTLRINEGNVRRRTCRRIDSMRDRLTNKRLTYMELTAD